MICNLGNNIAAFKERALIGFYFYNCFDTDRKNDILSVIVILFFITGVKKRNKRKGARKAIFSIISVLQHPFFFILLLIGGPRAFSNQCNKIFDSENVSFLLSFQLKLKVSSLYGQATFSCSFHIGHLEDNGT